MAALTLTQSDIALFSDPAATRVVIPTLRLWSPTKTYEQGLVRFEGDVEPTSFRGEGVATKHEVTCRYSYAEHADMVALLDLLDAAHEAPDNALQLRTATSDTPNVDRLIVGVVPEVPRSPLGGQAWDITFTLHQTVYTLVV